VGDYLLKEFVSLSRSGTLPASIPAILLWISVLVFYWRHRQLLAKADERRARQQFYREIVQGYLSVMALLTVVGIALMLSLRPIMATIVRAYFPPDSPPDKTQFVKTIKVPAIPLKTVAFKKPAPPEISYRGNSSQDFGVDWVVVDGEQLNGISMVLPAVNGRVSIVYSTGGRNIPAADLPQGFLDEWNISPGLLKAVDNSVKF
jgi:hypothetical protein